NVPDPVNPRAVPAVQQHQRRPAAPDVPHHLSAVAGGRPALRLRLHVRNRPLRGGELREHSFYRHFSPFRVRERRFFAADDNPPDAARPRRRVGWPELGSGNVVPPPRAVLASGPGPLFVARGSTRQEIQRLPAELSAAAMNKGKKPRLSKGGTER